MKNQKKNRNLLKQYDTSLNGEKVTISVLKSKKTKGAAHARNNYSSCPNCNSSLLINSTGVYECSKDKLEYWDQQFLSYYMMSDVEKNKYLKKISVDSMFFDLYNKWVYARENSKPEEFTCGYSNNISLPIGSNKTIIPDPLYVNFIEDRLKRPLTEEEKANESDLWIKGKKVKASYFKGSKPVKIPYIIFPDEVEVKV